MPVRGTHGADKLPPLTHHEIMAVIAPFARRSRHPDLAASDRLQRRIVFKPVERPATAAAPALRESLTLDNANRGSYRLTRLLTDGDGLTATLEAAGPDPQELLARIESVQPERHFGSGSGYRLVRNLSIEPWAPGSRADEPPYLRLTRGRVELADLSVTMKVPTVDGIPATVEIAPAAGPALHLPIDVLAVLGRDWAPLTALTGGWKCQLRLRGRGAACGRDAEDKLDAAARHLAQTLAESPRRFHERLGAARWAVAVRRVLPLLVSCGLIAAAAAVPRLHLAEDSVLRMLIFNSPPLLLLIAFCMRDLPKFELPSPPRPLRAASWRDSAIDPARRRGFGAGR